MRCSYDDWSILRNEKLAMILFRNAVGVFSLRGDTDKVDS